MIDYSLRHKLLAVAIAATSAAVVAQQPATQPPSQRTELELRIDSEPGTPTRMAVPELITLSSDKESQEAARVIGEVLWNDFDFEREFYMIPRDTYKTIPAATSVDSVPYERWRELGADVVAVGAVQRAATGIKVVMRLHSIRSQSSIYGREYTGSAANPRLYAHTFADELHLAARNLRGVARTKLTFISDRNREPVLATVERRDVKEVYISDYDGANPRRVTINRNMNLTPRWSPDGRSIAYTSYRTGVQDVLISNIFAATMENPTKGVGQNYSPVFSPDGTRIAFVSNRDGNNEIYVVNRDGSELRRLTNNPAIDSTPTWSPNGSQVAFTSDRSGSAQIWVVGSDGAGLRRISYETYADEATWSSPPFNEIAFAARTGPGFDIKILNIGTGETRQITFGEGSNERPTWAPNGRHLAFTSTRAGRAQIFTVDRDGRNVRQITRDGNNTMPHWSQ